MDRREFLKTVPALAVLAAGGLSFAEDAAADGMIPPALLHEKGPFERSDR